MSLFEQIRAAQKWGSAAPRRGGGKDKSGQIGNAPDCMRPVQVSSMPINVPKNDAAWRHFVYAIYCSHSQFLQVRSLLEVGDSS